MRVQYTKDGVTIDEGTSIITNDGYKVINPTRETYEANGWVRQELPDLVPLKRDWIREQIHTWVATYDGYDYCADDEIALINDQNEEYLAARKAILAEAEEKVKRGELREN